MNIKVVKADERNIQQAILLSEKSVVMCENGIPIKSGIFSPLTYEDLPYVFVALNQKQEVIGVIKAKKMTSKVEFSWFGVSEKEDAVILQKICVRDDMKRKHIASEILNYIKKIFTNSSLYADIMVEPIKNEPSIATFVANGFFECNGGLIKKWKDGTSYKFFKF